MAVRDKPKREMAASNAKGQETRAAQAARRADIEAHPIDWGECNRSLREWYEQRQQEGWK
jgi:hypothetical protein